MAKPKHKQQQQQPSSSTTTTTTISPDDDKKKITNNSNNKSIIKKIFLFFLILTIFTLGALEAYRIRLYPVKQYGRIIHEFDPWFHFSAARYLAENGLTKFFHWFDHRSWYPIGRPVGTTIYPGMQLTAVALWKLLKQPFWRDTFHFSPEMTLNDICVFIPAWFGSLASLVLGLLTREVSGSWLAGALSCAIMSVIPAHLMRSAAGEFDNECIAMFAMCLTFYLWCRSLRTRRSWWIGAFAGVAYAYMAAAWGGYIYVNNVVAIHAGVLILLGRRTASLHMAYTLWYVVGTLLATQIPVVGMAPFKSMEQAASLCVFLGFHALAFCDWLDRIFKNNAKQSFKMRAMFAGIGAVGVLCLLQLGFLAPFSIRVKSLFIKHTKTGNPLVDSVAEHQPASAQSYWRFLLCFYPLFPVGFVLVACIGASKKASETWGVAVNKYFILVFTALTYFFSAKMNRLVLLMAPVASALGGVVVERVLLWSFNQFILLKSIIFDNSNKKNFAQNNLKNNTSKKIPLNTQQQQQRTKTNVNNNNTEEEEDLSGGILKMYHLDTLIPTWNSVAREYNAPKNRPIRVFLAGFIMALLIRTGVNFWYRCDMHARYSSSPRIMFMAQDNRDGRDIMIRDYYDSYVWLRENTPADSRVLAWWDYGYHISGIANRTSLADGNTWNLEHIATVGRMLASPEEKAYNLTRMMADYVLVWAGGRGDDLGKSPHIARISSSVYDGICDNDPMCFSFGFNKDGTPTKTMAASMLYRMHSNGVKPGVRVNPEWFREVYHSEHGLVRIYKVLNVDLKAKKWAMNPKNWKCDRPGSWYCPGQYPPGFPKPPSTHKNINYHKLNVDTSRM